MGLVLKIKNYVTKGVNKLKSLSIIDELPLAIKVVMLMIDVFIYIFLLFITFIHFFDNLTPKSFFIFIMLFVLLPWFTSSCITRYKFLIEEKVNLNADYFQTLPVVIIWLSIFFSILFENNSTLRIMSIPDIIMFFLIPVLYHFLNYKEKKLAKKNQKYQYLDTELETKENEINQLLFTFLKNDNLINKKNSKK